MDIRELTKKLMPAIQECVKEPQKKAESIDEAIEVNRNSYEFSHGKAPRGEGNWMIGIGHSHIDFTKHKEGEHYISHYGKLGDALKKAKEVAKQNNKHTIHVLP